MKIILSFFQVLFGSVFLLVASCFVYTKSAANDLPLPIPPVRKPIDVKTLIIEYSRQYGVSPVLPLAIAKCESGYQWDAKNKSSSASGVFQYLKGTWKNTEAGKQGRSVFDPHANIQAAIKHLKHHGPAAWKSSQTCWGNK